MTSADQALAQLKKGNRAFRTRLDGATNDTGAQSPRLTHVHEPVAVVLSCSDARVPVQALFDQNIGELFVVRVIGNIATPTQIASIEYAVSALATPLVVVLGHTGCGAVKATLNALQHPELEHSAALRAVIDRISPAVAPLMSGTGDPGPRLAEEAVRANIDHTVTQLRQQTDLASTYSGEGRLLIVGAEYNLNTGEVVFFDENTTT